MTREEAIKIISQMIKDEEGFLSDNTVEAHKMAIKALEQVDESVVKSVSVVESVDAISRQAVIDAIYDNKSDFKNDFAQGFFADRIRDLPSVNVPETNVGNMDCISRQAVEEIITDIRDCISVEGYCAILERLKKLPPVNPKQTEITLESAIDYLHSIGWLQKHDKELTEGVKQEPKTGHWIDINSKDYELHRIYKCSECGKTEVEYPESIYVHYKYCPNCGSKMIEG